MERPFDSHIDNDELQALVPSFPEAGHDAPKVPAEALREAERHVLSCAECEAKVSKYRRLVSGPPSVIPQAAPPGDDCPKPEDVDWHGVAAGLWPELKARQLIMHAALCDHCGPLLRGAVSVQEDLITSQDAPPAAATRRSRPDHTPQPAWLLPPLFSFMTWLVPAIAIMVIIGVLTTVPSSTAPLSGKKFAEFAVSTHKQHAHGNMDLDIHTDSQQTLNEWFRAKSKFPLALPASAPLPGEVRPYHLQGARLVEVGGKTAAYVAYEMQPGDASLIVAPDSVAMASGGVEVDFKKVSFHYSMVDGYRVVTWSVHGLTYGLVSQEGNSTQKSCMVCHSPMRDRDLTNIPTPFATKGKVVESIFQ